MAQYFLQSVQTNNTASSLFKLWSHGGYDDIPKESINVFVKKNVVNNG